MNVRRPFCPRVLITCLESCRVGESCASYFYHFIVDEIFLKVCELLV